MELLSSLQWTVGVAASICCGNEDPKEARGKGYSGVGGVEKQVQCLGKKVSTGRGIMKRRNVRVIN